MGNTRDFILLGWQWRPLSPTRWPQMLIYHRRHHRLDGGWPLVHRWRLAHSIAVKHKTPEEARKEIDDFKAGLPSMFLTTNLWASDVSGMVIIGAADALPSIRLTPLKVALLYWSCRNGYFGITAKQMSGGAPSSNPGKNNIEHRRYGKHRDQRIRCIAMGKSAQWGCERLKKSAAVLSNLS